MDYTTNADMFSARFRLLENKSQAIPPRHPDGKLIQTRVQSHRTRFRSAVRRTHQNNANNAPVAVALAYSTLTCLPATRADRERPEALPYGCLRSGASMPCKRIRCCSVPTRMVIVSPSATLTTLPVRVAADAWNGASVITRNRNEYRLSREIVYNSAIPIAHASPTKWRLPDDHRPRITRC